MGNVIVENKNLTYLSFEKISSSSGTGGSFLKASETINGKKIYYKLSNYNDYDGVFGHESINEIIVDRLLDIFNIEHLVYQLIHADIIVNNKKINTWVCSSYDFKNKGESKMSFENYYGQLKNKDESVIDFCRNHGFEETIYKMLVVDYMILNRDRHGANLEVLMRRNGEIRLAPLFDHGFSLLYNCYTYEDAVKENVLEDKKVQSFFGGYSSYNNLSLIPKDKLPKFKHLDNDDKTYILKDLDKAIDYRILEKSYEMIQERQKEYEKFCNKK